MNPYFRPSNKLAAGVCLPLMLCAAHAAPQPWFDNGIVWGGPDQTISGYYRPGNDGDGPAGVYDNALPADADPDWYTGYPTPGASVNLEVPGTAGPGYLDVVTAKGTSAVFTTGIWTGNETWDASEAATVEFTLRINSMDPEADWAGTVQAGNAMAIFLLGLGVDSEGYLTVWNLAEDFPATTDLLASEFNTIRLLLSGMESIETSTAAVYLNNSSTPFATYTTFIAFGLDNLRFGEWHDGAVAGGGDVDWQSIKWLSGQAVTPIPEPGLTPLLVTGLFALSFAARTRRFLLRTPAR